MWNGLYQIQETMKSHYLEFRGECYSTFAQRWNMTDYLREFAMISLALVEYLRAITLLFLPSDTDDQPMILMRLDELSEALDVLRREEEIQTAVRSRANSSLSMGTKSYKNVSEVSFGATIGEEQHNEDDVPDLISLSPSDISPSRHGRSRSNSHSAFNKQSTMGGL
jgi:hypothetical protein